MSEHKSEVARWRQQYDAEYEAAQRGLTGLAYGSARHSFITKKMENMQQCVQELTALVGVQQAGLILWGEQIGQASTLPTNDTLTVSLKEDEAC
jgi:hypothetical protein